MVDRITPATTDRERSLLDRVRLVDSWPVFCEPFKQWVLEDKFPAAVRRSRRSASRSSTMSAFELMKIRILNGGHAAS